MRTLLKPVTLLFVISLILSACNPVKSVEAIKSDITRDTQPVVAGRNDHRCCRRE